MDQKLDFSSLPENIRVAVLDNKLDALKPADRVIYHDFVCRQKGLDPSSRPFEFIKLNGKLAMYARKECADQLRAIHGISCEIVSQTIQGGAYFVHVRATTKDGRTEDDIGATSIMEPEFIEKYDNGEKRRVKNPRHGSQIEAMDFANAMMKACTKGKRRVTLSISGLGMFDSTEVEDIRESDKGRAPTLQEIKDTCDRILALKEEAAKCEDPDKRRAILAKALELEDGIMDQEGSTHTPTQAAKADEKPKAETPVEQPAKAAPVPQPASRAVEQETTGKSSYFSSLPEDVQEAISQIDTTGWRDHVFMGDPGLPAMDFIEKKATEIPRERLIAAVEKWIPKNALKTPQKTLDAAMVLAALAE